MLPKVWPTISALHANTLEIPVAWEQIEPVEGKFDFSWLDTLLPQARAERRSARSAVVRHMEEHRPELRARMGEVGHASASRA